MDFEKTVEQFCDKYCKYPYICADEEKLQEVCENCPICKLAERVEELEGAGEDFKNRCLAELNNEKSTLNAMVNHNYREGLERAAEIVENIKLGGDKDANITD